MNNGFLNLRLFVSNAALFVETDDSNAWCVHFGASIYMLCNKCLFGKFYETNNGANIYLGDYHPHYIKGYGDVPVTLPNGNAKHINNVVYVPSIKKKLIFISTIKDNNLNVNFVKLHCLVKYMQDHFNIYATSVRLGGLYKLDVQEEVIKHWHIQP